MTSLFFPNKNQNLVFWSHRDLLHFKGQQTRLAFEKA